MIKKFRTHHFTLYLLLHVLPLSAWAVSADFVALLDNVLSRQPQQQLTTVIKEQHQSYQSYAKSWIADDIDVIIHHENDALTDNNDYQNWQLGLEFPLWWGEQKKAQRQLSQTFAEEILVWQDYLRWKASQILRELGWNLRIAHIEVMAAESTLAQSRELLNKVAQKVAAGESPEIDKLLAEKAVLKQQNELVKKQSALTIAQKQFQSWTGTTQLPERITEHTLSQIPWEQHPYIRLLNIALKRHQAMMAKTRAKRRQGSRLFLGAQNDSDNSSNSNALIFELSIPMGISPRYDMQVSDDKRNIYEQQAKIDDEIIRLKQEVFKAQQNLASARQMIQFSRKQFEISKKALQMSTQAYQLGETGIQNLLLVQQQLAEAQLEYQLAKAGSGKAVAELNQVSGHILGVSQ